MTEISNTVEVEGEKQEGALVFAVRTDDGDPYVVDWDTTDSNGEYTLETGAGIQHVAAQYENAEQYNGESWPYIDTFEDAFFEVRNISAPSEVDEDESFSVSATIDNTDGREDTQDIVYLVDGSQEDVDPSVTIEDNTYNASFNDSIGSEGTYSLEIASDDDADSTTIEVVSAIPDSVVSQEDWQEGHIFQGSDNLGPPPTTFNDGNEANLIDGPEGDDTALELDLSDDPATGGDGGPYRWERSFDLSGVSTLEVTTYYDALDELQIRVGGDTLFSTSSSHDWTERSFDVSDYGEDALIEFLESRSSSWSSGTYRCRFAQVHFHE